MSEIAPISRHNEQEAKDSLADKIRQASVDARKNILKESVDKEATTILPPKHTGWKTDFPVYLRQSAGGKDINGIRPGATLKIIGGPETTRDSQTKEKDTTHFWYKVQVNDRTQLNTKAYGKDNIGWVSAEFLRVKDNITPIPLEEPGPTKKPLPEIQKELTVARIVPGRPGLVYSPFGENGIVDVSGIDPTKPVLCPYTQKLFRIPGDFLDAQTPPLPETPPTSGWHRNNVETADGNIGESNGDRAWSGRWIDPSFDIKDDTPIQTYAIGDIVYFDKEGWITGEAGIAYFDAATKKIQEYPVSGIGKITGIKKTDDKVFILGEDGFAVFNKTDKEIVTHAEIGMIRNPGNLGIETTIVGKKGVANLADGGDSYTFTPLDKIGEIISIENRMENHIRAKEGVAYKKDYEWIQVPLSVGEIKYFGYFPQEGTSNIAFGENGLAIIEEGKETLEHKNLGEDYTKVLKILTESNTDGEHGNLGIYSEIENGMIVGQNYGSGNGEILSIVLNKEKSEPFLKEVTNITEKIIELDVKIAAKDFEAARKNMEEAEKMLGEGTMKETSKNNPIKENLIKQIEEKKKQLETTGSVEQTGKTYKVQFKDGKMIEHVTSNDMAEKLVRLGSEVWNWEKGGITFDESGKFTGLETSVGKFEEVRDFIETYLGKDCKNLENNQVSYVASNSHGLTAINTSTSKDINISENTELGHLEAVKAPNITGLENLKKLTKLIASSVVTLDVSKNTDLEYLLADETETLDLTKNTKLLTLSADKATKIIGLEKLKKLERISLKSLEKEIPIDELPLKEKTEIWVPEKGDTKATWKRIEDIKVDGLKIDGNNLSDYIYIGGVIEKKDPITSPPVPGGPSSTPTTAPGGPLREGMDTKTIEYSAGNFRFQILKDTIQHADKPIAKFEGNPKQNVMTKLDFKAEASPDQIKAIIGDQAEITGLNILNVGDKDIALDLSSNKNLTNIEASWKNNLSTWKFPAVESSIKLGDMSFNVTETEGNWMMNGPTLAGSGNPTEGPYDIIREEDTNILHFTPKKLNKDVFHPDQGVENIPGMGSAYIRYILNSPENIETDDEGNPHSKFHITKLGDVPESSGVNKPFDYIGNGENGDYTLGHSSYEKVVINSIKYERDSNELIINVTPDGFPPIDITYGK